MIKKAPDIKILATLGPSSMERSVVQKMDSAGVDIFRINLSHTKIEDFKSAVLNIRNWTKKPICVDIEGAQIRTGKIKNGKVKIKNNSLVYLTPSEVLGDEFNIPLYPILAKDTLQIGDILAIDFYSVIVQVVQIKDNKVLSRVLSEGEVCSNKGVNVDRQIKLPAFTQKDLKAFKLSKEMGLSYFALSFAEKKEDVEAMRDHFFYPIFAISKIESRAGLNNLEDICRASDAVLIDRGDLSREVPLQKIALAQKHILEIANKVEKPVFVATNLLETMVDNFEPTRAEINDITSTLLSGAKGLVLAAETAIGKHPIQSVRMASGVRKEVENYIVSDKKSYFNSIYDYNLIEPHGGVLVQNFVETKEIDRPESLPSIEVSERILSDIVQISEGTYSPIRGFMNKDELMSVLSHYKLPDGVVWTLPVLLQFSKKDINFDRKETIAIKWEKDKKIYAIMKVDNVQRIDLFDVAKKWFGTKDQKHPGVANFMRKGDYIASGKVFLFEKPKFCLGSYNLTPRQARQVFKDRGWQKIVGFHTRNVVHRGHEFIQKKALESVGAEALFISPVVGHKKTNDFSAEAILKSYEIMLENSFYDGYPALISVFNTYSRYSGPREAVFTALCRKNFGCSHFIIGRDHTGVGSYYPSDASQRIFDKLGDVGIEPIMFTPVYFCKVCSQVTTNCNHNRELRLSLSGTDVRKHLLEGLEIPEYLMRKEISEFLQKMYKNNKDKLFEKG